MSSVTSSTAGQVADSRSGFLPDRVIHLHPTRRCNLSCLHCYSESDPRRKESLDPNALCSALELLRTEGYGVISLSGGEPLLFAPLRSVVERSRELGYRVTMISNGLMPAERVDRLLPLLDNVAISFDGLAPTHDALRGRDGAFESASACVRRIAAQGRPVSAAISLTRSSIPDLPDLVDHLVGLGVRAIQIRPVARAGRARSLADSSFFGASDRARLYLVVMALQQELQDQVRVHCDLAPSDGLWRQRDDYAGLLGECAEWRCEDRLLSDLVNPLVITEVGRLKPIAYDFDARFDIGSIDELSPQTLHAYKRTRVSGLRELVARALADMQHRGELVDWFDHCTRISSMQVARRPEPEHSLPAAHQRA